MFTLVIAAALLVPGPVPTALYRYDESTVPVAERRTDPRVDPWPDRRLLLCDAGVQPDWRVVGQAADGCPVYHHRGADGPGPGPWSAVSPWSVW
jgi:hypothetical protein